MEDVVETGWLSCPACNHTEYSEEILYKMFEPVETVKEGKEKPVPILEGVQVECTCKKCYFSWYMMPLNVSETTH